MGYFANGTEIMWYDEQYCEQCIHGQDVDYGPSACPVHELHSILGNNGYVDCSESYNYEQCRSEEPGPTIRKILRRLIPTDGGGNGKCLIFKGQDEMEWYKSLENTVKCHLEELRRFQEFVWARPGDDFRADSQEFATLLDNVTSSAAWVQDHWDNPRDYCESL